MKKKNRVQNNIVLFIFNLIIITIVSTITLVICIDKFIYKKTTQSMLIEDTAKLAQEYDNGMPIETFKETVEWFNSKTSYNMIVLNDLNKLQETEDSSQYSMSISEEDRKKLIQGDVVIRTVENHEFVKLIVLNPLIKEGNFEGVLCTYTFIVFPENTILTFLFCIGFGFLGLFSIYIAIKIFKSIVKPIKEMEMASLKVSAGDFSTTICYSGSDEIGRLAKAFNEMSNNIREASIRRREFIENISHEFRTPLSYVHGYTKALIDGLVKAPEDQMKYLKLIEKESNRLTILVEDLLEIVKLEADKLDIDKSPLALAQCIEETMEQYKEVLGNNKIHLKLNLNPDVIINGNEIRMKQIIQHIIENAIRYSKKDGSIEVQLLKEGSYCYLIIKDNGIGMSEEDLQQVKNIFYRVNKARTRLDGGSGLGLSIVDQLVKSHDGQVKIESAPNIGTKVTIQLPIILFERGNEY